MNNNENNNEFTACMQDITVYINENHGSKNNTLPEVTAYVNSRLNEITDAFKACHADVIPGERVQESAMIRKVIAHDILQDIVHDLHTIVSSKVPFIYENNELSFKPSDEEGKLQLCSEHKSFKIALTAISIDENVDDEFKRHLKDLHHIETVSMEVPSINAHLLIASVGINGSLIDYDTHAILLKQQAISEAVDLLESNEQGRTPTEHTLIELIHTLNVDYLPFREPISDDHLTEFVNKTMHHLHDKITPPTEYLTDNVLNNVRTHVLKAYVNEWLNVTESNDKAYTSILVPFVGKTPETPLPFAIDVNETHTASFTPVSDTSALPSNTLYILQKGYNKPNYTPVLVKIERRA